MSCLLSSATAGFRDLVLVAENKIKTLGITWADAIGFDASITAWTSFVALYKANLRLKNRCIQGLEDLQTYPDVSLLAGLTCCTRFACVGHL